MTYWSISSQVLREEAEALGLEVEVLVPEKNLFFVRSSQKSVLFKSTDFGGNTALGKKIADDKELSYHLLERHGMPIPKTAYVNAEDVSAFDWTCFEAFRFPVIVKPVDGAHGKGVQMGIRDIAELREKLAAAFVEYPRMIVQEQVSGEECRVLVVLGKVLLALHRIPPSVRWDGKSTVHDLIDAENNGNPMRKSEYNAPLSHIEEDEELIDFIAKKGYSLQSVLPDGMVLQLRWNSNLGTGWSARDVTDILHEDTKRLCVDVAEKFGLGICWVDILSSDFSKPLSQTGGMILEVNATPGIWGDRELSSVNTWREMLKLIFDLA
jgi:cyanophycin synthetase